MTPRTWPAYHLPVTNRPRTGISVAPARRGGSWLGRRREMPVLDGTMVQVQFGGRCPVRLCVLLPDPSHVLLSRLLADAQAPGHRLDGHARRIQPQRTGLLSAQRRPVRRVVRGEDAGQAGRN